MFSIRQESLFSLALSLPEEAGANLNSINKEQP